MARRRRALHIELSTWSEDKMTELSDIQEAYIAIHSGAGETWCDECCLPTDVRMRHSVDPFFKPWLCRLCGVPFPLNLVARRRSGNLSAALGYGSVDRPMALFEDPRTREDHAAIAAHQHATGLARPWPWTFDLNRRLQDEEAHGRIMAQVAKLVAARETA
jgi:hypothetical protein